MGPFKASPLSRIPKFGYDKALKRACLQKKSVGADKVRCPYYVSSPQTSIEHNGSHLDAFNAIKSATKVLLH